MDGQTDRQTDMLTKGQANGLDSIQIRKDFMIWGGKKNKDTDFSQLQVFGLCWNSLTDSQRG